MASRPRPVAPDDWFIRRAGSLLTRLLGPLGRSRGVERARKTWTTLKREGILFIMGIAFVSISLGGVVVYLIEQGGEEPLMTSVGDALWYSLVTVATVGYGDYTPKTPLGRAVGSVLILLGVAIFSAFSATIASIFVAQRIREGRGLETIKFKNHVLVCGWNAHGERVLAGLKLAQRRERTEVVLVNELSEDEITEVLSRIEGRDVRYIRGDPAVEAVLHRASAAEARAAIVLADTSHGAGIPSDERTTLIILALNGIQKEMRICAEALELDSEPHLKRAGATDLVVRGEFNGFLLSTAALAPGVPEVARQVLALGASELRREPIPPELVGRSFGEAFSVLRSRDGFLALAIVTEAKGLALDDLLTDDYSLVDNFIKDQFSAAGMEHLRFAEGGIQVTVNPPDSYVIGRSDTAIGIGLTQWPTSTA